MENKSEKQHTGLKWLKVYNEELGKIKDVSPLLLVLCVSAGIEFIGKLLSTDDIDNGNKCNIKFEDALGKFASLKKYESKDFYHLVRCGLAHRIGVKEGIILSPSQESDLESKPIRLNTNQFYKDFSQAVEDAQTSSLIVNPIATLPYISVNEFSETGSTITILEYLQ